MFLHTPYSILLKGLINIDLYYIRIYCSTYVRVRTLTFTNNFWQELFKLQGTQLHLSNSYHSQTDGQNEVVNKCLETYLRCSASDRQHQWAQWLPLATWEPATILQQFPHLKP